MNNSILTGRNAMDIEKLKSSILDLYIASLKFLPVKKRIVFESHPEFTCNTYAVYRYLIDEYHIDDKYKIVWVVGDPDKYKNSSLKNTSFIKFWQKTDPLMTKVNYHRTLAGAKALIYGNRLLGKYRDDQLSMCLQHGMPLKASHGAYCIKDKCDKCLCVSEFFTENYSRDFEVSPEKLFYMGFPRNDYLFSERDVRREMGLDSFDKVIIWLPTYRKHTSVLSSKFNIEGSATGIPTINTNDEILKVDAWLQENNCCLILKPHPAQQIGMELRGRLKNFKIITNDDLKELDIQLYELLGKTDALVTDYSSVFYDYLLTDKPIGLTVDDLDSYTSARGFVYDDPKEVLKGEYINDTDELISFFESVKRGEDAHLDERTEVKNKIHKYQHGGSAKMIGDYIMELIK